MAAETQPSEVRIAHDALPGGSSANVPRLALQSPPLPPPPLPLEPPHSPAQRIDSDDDEEQLITDGELTIRSFVPWQEPAPLSR
jgi:hypothetical protein